MKPPPFEIKEARGLPTAPDRTPKLLWPSLNAHYEKTDLKRFPTWEEENNRRAVGEFGAWSPEFMLALRGARDRIWVIDAFLFKNSTRTNNKFFEIVEKELFETTAQDIRFIAEGKDGHQDQIAEFRILQNLRREPPQIRPFTIDVQLCRGGKSAMQMPHDRFAIIDDELWHWGANVGGTHHDVNAYSRGWSAQETGADKYFVRLWKKLKELRS